MKKTGKTELALTILAGSALFTLELLDELFNYNKSYKQARGMMYGAGYGSKKTYSDTELQRFYSLLNGLKHQGFIVKKNKNKNSLWAITSSGLNKLKLIKDKKTDYQTFADNKSKIIIYDIPESLKRHRAWLREALHNLGFKILQKSVWIGKNKIPENFLLDLRNKNLIDCVHVLEVTKTGSIKELI